MPSFHEAQFRHASYYRAVLRQAQDFYLQGGEAISTGLNLFEDEWSNIQAGQSWAEKNAPQDRVAASLCSEYAADGALLLDLRQHPQENVRWLETALAAARQINDLAAEGSHCNSLGATYAKLASPHQAIEFYHRALTIAREI